MHLRRSLCILLALAATAASAQKVYTDHDYAQAERWMSYNTSGLVHHTISRPDYLSDGRVFFRDPGTDSTAYKIADPVKGTVTPAFDNAKLAAAITQATGKTVTANRLGVLYYYAEPSGFAVTTRTGTFHCDGMASKCSIDKPQAAADAPTGRRKPSINVSPDGKLGAYILNNNLWVRTVATGAEKQLTFDGAQDFGYATDNAGWQHSDSAVVTWSADSKKIATFQQDQRKTGSMYLVPITNRHPQLEAWKYPLVGDKDVTMIEPVVIDVEAAKVTRLKIAPLQHRSMECDDVSCDGDGRWTDAEFSPDASKLAFVATSRDHKDEDVKLADTATGDVKQIYHEHVDTYYGWQAKIDWKVLWSSNEFLWASERSNFAQYYLYDLNTGKLKNAVTHGDGPVYQLPYVDEKSRTAYFTATGRTPGIDPYFEQLFSVSLDGSHQTLLTPEPAEHQITAAPDGSSFVDIYSTAQEPRTAVLRDRTGKVIVTLGKQDVSQLVAAGWKPSLPVKVKARDGKTDLYGFLVRPTNFDPSKKYPLVDYIYPGPQDGSCGGPEARSFQVSHGDNQAMADLGMVVICLDGQGNPHRSKAFHDAHASTPADMGDDTIPDQVSGIKDLAAQYPWIDLDHVGIWGHSGGGNATVSAMFHAPDVFKVGWSESGNHDNRDYEDDWDERWAGLETISPEGKSNYDAHANQNYAKNLKGHLMLVHGTMDDNVPPSNTLLVVDALIKANKDFDLIMVPNVHHGYAQDTQYITRRRWDYFVTHLLGATPPHEYHMATTEEVQRKMAASGPDDDDDEDID